MKIKCLIDVIIEIEYLENTTNNDTEFTKEILNMVKNIKKEQNC